MSKKSGASRKPRPVGIVLPVVVLGIGLTAIVMGVPKETRVLALRGTGASAMAHISSIEHTNKTTNLRLIYSVRGHDHAVDYSLPDNEFEALPEGHEFKVLYTISDPTVASADIDKDSKIALGYLVAGALDLLVGLIVLRTGVLLRKRLAKKD